MIRFFTLFLCAISLFAQTASFPTSVATDSELLTGVKDRAESKLSSSIDDSTLLIPVDSGSAFAANMLATIEDEQVKICAVTSNTLTICSSGRGFAGTTKASHGGGKSVRGQVSSWYYKRLAKELQATQNYLAQFQAGSKISEDVVLFPGTDNIYTSRYLGEKAPTSGRHFASVTVMDLCNAYGIGGACVSSQSGAGDKVSGFYGAQPGPPATTTLTAAITANQMTIPLASGSILPQTLNSSYPVRIKIDNEEIALCGIVGNTAIVCTGGRGYFSTTAASHASGASCKGISDVWGMNIQTVKRGDIGANVNVNGLELDVHEYFENWTNTPGQRGNTGIIVTSAGSYQPSHGLIINSTTDSNSFWLPASIKTGGRRGLMVGPMSAPIDEVNSVSSIAAKQLYNGDTVYFGQRLTDSSPSGYFFRFWSAAGSELVSLDVNGKFVTSGTIRAQGGAPSLDLMEGDAATDAKLWRIEANGNQLGFYVGNDTESSFGQWMAVTRSGASPLRVKIFTLLNLGTTPSYANNAAAVAAGLLVGDVYFVSGTEGHLAVRY